jgi:Tfp pilus assembly protein PilF
VSGCGHYLDTPVQKRIFLLAYAAVAFSQTPQITTDPAYAELDKAYQALKVKEYDRAIAGFERAIALAPDRPSVRKDLAYTLLKVGETAAARDQFAEAMRLDPGDDQVALEYAFLCYETRQEVTARRIFDRYRKSSATAAQAFENIDRPLREGIERWKQALAVSPDNFSGHQELARLAEQRDELPLAAEHYERAWRLRPDHRELLLDLGRVWKQLDRAEEAGAALLAASRGAEASVAEHARELLPARYPYVYEFEKALALDPSNVELRREFAYLQLKMERQADAETQFAGVVERAPEDLLSAAQLGLLKMARGDGAGAMALLNRVLLGGDEELADRVRTALRLPQTLRGRPEEPRAMVSNQAKELAFKSLEKGYLQDALRYLTVAHENDPVDFDVMLKLGWANNLLKDDRDAVKWFNLARKSPNVKTAAEAARASRNLAPRSRASAPRCGCSPLFRRAGAICSRMRRPRPSST